jgi:RimJ/RimL family protein N-acetyltransferase
MTTIANRDLRPALTTERLRLRRPDGGDAASILAIVGDIEVSRYLARVPHPYTADDAAFFLNQIVPNEWVWAITLQGDDELIGMVGLTPEEGGQTAELGYWLAKPYWGQGIASEAARRVIKFGFAELGLPCITSGFFTGNPASGAVLLKLGFVEQGETMRSHLAAGKDMAAKELRIFPHLVR